MSDKAKDFFAAFKAGKMSRRELMAGAGKLGITRRDREFHAQRGGDGGDRRRLRLDEIQGDEAAPVCSTSTPTRMR